MKPQSPKIIPMMAFAVAVMLLLFTTAAHAVNGTFYNAGTDTLWSDTSNWVNGVQTTNASSINYGANSGTMTIDVSATCGAIQPGKVVGTGSSITGAAWLFTGLSATNTLTMYSTSSVILAGYASGTTSGTVPIMYLSAGAGSYSTFQNLTISGTQGLLLRSGANSVTLGSGLTWNMSGTLYLSAGSQGSQTFVTANNTLSSLDVNMMAGNYTGTSHLQNGLYQSRVIINGATTLTIGALNSTINSGTDAYGMTYYGNAYISAYASTSDFMYTTNVPSGTGVTATVGNTSTYATLKIGSTNKDGNYLGTIGAGYIALTSTTGGLDTSSTAGAINVVKIGTGTQTFSGTNYYIGTTTVNGGTLKAGVANMAFGKNSAVTLSNTAGATLDLNSYNQTIGSLAGGGASGGNVTLGTAILTTGSDNTSTTFAGIISGSGGLTKVGTGMQTLTGNNTYTGATVVSGGTLGVNGSLASGSVSVGTGAVLAGSGTIAGLVSSTGSIIGSLTFSNDVTINNGGTAAASAFNGNITDNGTITSAVNVQSGKILSGSGSVTNTVTGTSATINGSALTLGDTTLYGASTLSGHNIANSVTVAGGTTTLTGTTKSTSALTVAAGATLNANGTIDGSAAVSGLLKGNSTLTGNLSLTSGTLSSGNSPGITTVQGDFTMDSSSKLVAEVSGTVAGSSYDQVKVSGNVSLAGTLDLSTLSGLAQGTTITLIDNRSNGTTTGYFSSIITSGSTYAVTSGSTYTFTIGTTEYSLSYTSNGDGDGYGNDVTLSVVPEPGTWAMLVGGIGMLGFVQRLRRREN